MNWFVLGVLTGVVVLALLVARWVYVNWFDQGPF
jgi:hypothetical protein